MNDIIIPRNTPCPVELSHSAEVKTTTHGENAIDIYLLQGESQRVLDNAVLGRYEVTAIPHQKKKTRVNIGFAYDLSGVVKVDCTLNDGTHLPVDVVQTDLELTWTDQSPEECRCDPVTVCLLLDTSLSMSGQGIFEAKQAANRFLTECDTQAQIGLVEFGRTPGRTLCNMTNDRNKLRSAIEELNAGNGTPLTEGLQTSRSLIQDAQAQQILIVLTDGAPNDAVGALAVADQLKADGVRIIAVGAGSSINEEFLRKLASNPEDGMNVDFSQLTSTFGRIAQAMGSSSGIGATGGLFTLKRSR